MPVFLVDLRMNAPYVADPYYTDPYHGLLLCVHQTALQRHQHTLATPVAQESRKKTEAISLLTYICKNVSMYV